LRGCGILRSHLSSGGHSEGGKGREKKADNHRAKESRKETVQPLPKKTFPKEGDCFNGTV